MALFGFACGIGFLTKGFLAFALPLLVIVPFMIWENRWKELFSCCWLPLGAALLTVMPWSLAGYLQAPDYWHYFFWVEHIKRFWQKCAAFKTLLVLYTHVDSRGFPLVSFCSTSDTQFMAFKNQYSVNAIRTMLAYAPFPLLIIFQRQTRHIYSALLCTFGNINQFRFVAPI